MKTITSDGIFVFLGQTSNLEIFGDAFKLDERGCIRADEDMGTNIDGVFAVCEYFRKNTGKLQPAEPMEP